MLHKSKVIREGCASSWPACGHEPGHDVDGLMAALAWLAFLKAKAKPPLADIALDLCDITFNLKLLGHGDVAQIQGTDTPDNQAGHTEALLNEPQIPLNPTAMNNGWAPPLQVAPPNLKA
jgi:hypothetical protein